MSNLKSVTILELLAFNSHFYRASAVAASPVLAMIGMSVRPYVRLSVRHTLTLCENDASQDHEIFTDG